MTRDRPDVATHTQDGATVVISHRVRTGREADYERWLEEIIPACKSYPGHLGIQVIRPVPGATREYTHLIRFDSRDHLLAWMNSPEREQLIAKVQPLLAADDRYVVRSGLDFWFTPQGASIKVPTRWKQFLITWSVIYPLVLIVPEIIIWVSGQLDVIVHRYIVSLLATAAIVFLMIYVIMPRYTKLVSQWLYR
ncbi:antibiotic biosynthesis monooxygenase [Rhodoligotrophos defluvii]|uniref:antibiotic biosynthesis monooxygenase n=1 Tax=Rhodoligotrophos defluvii TaxID=2561934 RepID=UPI0010C9A462|nr:antibiotic biosynthesis monooxygenase [Rhodoligotrophos defluvii]